MATFDLGKVVGPQGPQGATGPAGPQGAKGATGATGAQGPQGKAGETGPIGPQGPAATIAVGTVTAGAAGSTPTVTNKGTETAAVLDFMIPRGNTGPQGATGPAGPQGAKGATGATGPQGPQGAKGATGATGTRGTRWSQGTAITGTSTTDAIFASSGITDALVNDMYLNTSTGYVYRCTVAGAASVAKWVYVGSLKGPTGAKGATGADGPAGPQGATGATGAQGPRGYPAVVNGVSPDDSGAITLTAADLKAYTKVQVDAALSNKADGAFALYGNLADIGLKIDGVTMDVILSAMHNSSILVTDVTSAWPDNVTPTKYGTLIIEKRDSSRVSCRFVGVGTARMWVATVVTSNTNSFGGWFGPLAIATPPQAFDLPLAADWEVANPLYDHAKYYKNQVGEVTLTVTIKSSTVQLTSDTIIATIPAGFRPAFAIQAACCAMLSNGSRVVAGRIACTPSGYVHIYSILADAGETVQVLSGSISYPTP